MGQVDLKSYAAEGQEGHLFVGPQGGQLWRSNFRDDWIKARRAAGVSPPWRMPRNRARPNFPRWEYSGGAQ